jgi:hypothetical protein
MRRLRDDRRRAKDEFQNWLIFYNGKKLQSILSYMSQMAFEKIRLAKENQLFDWSNLAKRDAERRQVQVASRTGDVSTPAMIDAPTPSCPPSASQRPLYSSSDQ